MFSPEVLISNIRPRGLSMGIEVVSAPELPGKVVGVNSYDCERMFYRAHVEGLLASKAWAKCQVDFSLPVPDERGVFQIGSQQRVIIQEGLVNVEEYTLTGPLRFYFRPPERIFLLALNQMFNAAFMEFYMRGQPPISSDIQNSIDGWFKTSEMTQEAPQNPIALQSLREMVYLRIPNEGMDLSLRHFPEYLWGAVDPASTPHGGKVNLAFRVTKGTRILRSSLAPSGEIFCSTIQNHGLAACYTPRRNHLLRAALEATLPLVQYENPLVGSQGLAGRHLRTAIMEFRTYTGKDAIVISESAAEKLRVIREYTESFHAIGDVHVIVKKGDEILPESLLAEATDPFSGEKTEFRSRKARFPITVKDVRASKTSLSGIAAVKISVICEARAKAESGDKVITRQAVKGVVHVVADERMPEMPDGRKVEAIISPESVVGRRAMGVYWEMMANAYVQKTKQQVIADHFAPRPSFVDLVEAGFGDPQQLTLRGKPLQNQTFVGLVYFVRVDKLAAEIVSAHDGKLILNGFRVQVDNARMSGQKRDLSKNLSMLARGLSKNFTHSLKTNMHGQHAFSELVKVLQPHGAVDDRQA